MNYIQSFQSWLGVTNTYIFAGILIASALFIYGYAFFKGRENRRKDEMEDRQFFDDDE